MVRPRWWLGLFDTNVIPKSAIGVNLSGEQVRLCNSFYNDNRLKFIQEDSENLPIEK